MADSTVVLEDSRQVTDLHDVIVRTLQSVDEPMTPATLRPRLPGPYQIALPDLTQTLQTLAQAGRIHRFSPYRSKADRFWTHSLRDYAIHLLTTETIDRFETKAYCVKQFKARLKGLSEKELGDLIQQLVRTGQMHSGKFLGSSSVRYSASLIDAKALLANAVDQIARRFSMPLADVRNLVAASDDFAESFTNTVSANSPTNGPSKADAAVSAETLVNDAIHELRPGGGGSIVPIIELRRFLEFKLGRESFNSALQKMERDGMIDFTLHPDPASLDDSARQDRTLGDRGKIYDMLIVRR